MFGRKTPIDKEIDRVVRHLATLDIGSDDYVTCVKALDDLTDLTTQSKVSKDVLASAMTNLLGIVMIIKHEHVNVIASKAMSLLIKPKPL